MQARTRGGPLEPSTLPVLKFMLAGNSGVGKTSLLLRFVDDKFTPSFITTIGIDFKLKTVQLSDGTRVRLQIWDTAGQERFRTITTAYYRGAMAIAVVYDVTNLESFRALTYWFDQVDLLTVGVEQKPFLVLVGNKTDMEHSRCVKKADAQSVAASRGYAYAETSACTADGVEKLFLDMADTVWSSQRAEPEPPVVHLTPESQAQATKKACC